MLLRCTPGFSSNGVVQGVHAGAGLPAPAALMCNDRMPGAGGSSWCTKYSHVVYLLPGDLPALSHWCQSIRQRRL